MILTANGVGWTSSCADGELSQLCDCVRRTRPRDLACAAAQSHYLDEPAASRSIWCWTEFAVLRRSGASGGKRGLNPSRQASIRRTHSPWREAETIAQSARASGPSSRAFAVQPAAAEGPVSLRLGWGPGDYVHQPASASAKSSAQFTVWCAFARLGSRRTTTWTCATSSKRSGR